MSSEALFISSDKDGGDTEGGGGRKGKSIEQKTKPPPTKLIPSGAVCLRGKLLQETRDNAIIQRITGLWSMGLDKILADPENNKGECSDFEYEHKNNGEDSAAASAAFPPSGTYSGSFMINNAGVKTKVEENDVELNFVENNEGYYNVEGKGSNSFGNYTITGVLSQEGVITIYRHYPSAPIVQPNKTKKESVSQGVKPPPTQLIPTGVVCLRGNLSRTTKENTTVHRITGLWSMGLDKILDDPENKKGDCNGFEYEHKSIGETSAAVFPLSGKYTGSFFVNSPQGCVKTKVEERDVILKFRENNEGYHNVEGKGSNVWGKYSITGTLTKEGEITLFRHYQAAKRESVKPAVKPPPTQVIPTGVVCLRGNLSRTTKDNTTVHRITGLWSMGLDKILDDPENKKGDCNGFEYEHKSIGETSAAVFPLSGKYTGSFFVNSPQGCVKTKVEERDVMLKFRENNEGYHNVEGKGSNVWGKYSITGTLTKEGEITLFRHYQADTQPKKAKKAVAAAAKQNNTPAQNNTATNKPSSPNKNFIPTDPNTAAGEYLLERLRILLNRLQSSKEILQNWPETQGDSAKIHADTGTELIASIRKIVTGLRSVERHVNGTGPSPAANISPEALETFRISLDEKCPIPLDLLDLLDIGQPFGINPLCYARGLMKEAMRQLAGLERRKKALAMLGDAIEKGLNERSKTNGVESVSDSATKVTASKRKIDESDEIDVVVTTSKKVRTD